jgi:hypothetical protein
LAVLIAALDRLSAGLSVEEQTMDEFKAILALHRSDGYDYCHCGWRVDFTVDKSWDEQHADHIIEAVKVAGLAVVPA